MSVLARRLPALSLLLACGCATRAAPPDEVDCSTWAADSARLVDEPAEPRARLAPALRALADECSGLDALLREGATLALDLPREERAAALARASAPAAGEECRAPHPLADSVDLAARCPLPVELGMSEAALRDLDAGTYAWARMALIELDGAGRLDEDAERVFLSLFLAAALDGEAARDASR